MEQTRRELYIVIERDEDGLFVGEAPQLRACYSQGRTPQVAESGRRHQSLGA